MSRMSFNEAAAAVKLTLDIVDVVGKHVAIKKRGRNFTGLCPFHQEKTPSFNVNPERQVFKCFGCGKGGDSLAFLMELEGKSYGELIRELADDQGIEIARDNTGEPQISKDEKDILFELQTHTQRFFETHLQTADSVKGYLDNRKIPDEWQKRFGIGFAPLGWENLVNHLRQVTPEVQNNPKLLDMAGLANIRSEGSGYYDRFRNRLMIPIHDDRGRIVAFGGRALSDEDNPKYLNSPETAIYVKSRVLYGLHLARETIRQSKYAILMEGYFDVIGAHMSGVTQAVGVCGTALTDNHLKLLQRSGAETLYLCFDSDEAGQTAAFRSIELIQQVLLDQGMMVKVIRLPGEKDPDDFFKTQGVDAFMDCLRKAQDFLSFRFERVLAGVADKDTPQGRIQAVRAVSPLLLSIGQPLIRQEQIRNLAEELNLSEETLTLEVKRLEMQNNPYPNKKNYQEQAISIFQDRYGKKQRNNRSGRWQQQKPRPEDMSLDRQMLSRMLPLEEKEHQLVSYLFINTESYELTMNALAQTQLQSPSAKSLVEAVQEFIGVWQNLDELIAKLNDKFYMEEKPEMNVFLADRLMTASQLEAEILSHKGGLKSESVRDKLNRVIGDMINRIELLRKRAALTSLTQIGKQLENQEDALEASAVQKRLRDALAHTSVEAE